MRPFSPFFSLLLPCADRPGLEPITRTYSEKNWLQPAPGGKKGFERLFDEHK